MELATLGTTLAHDVRIRFSGELWTPEDPGYDEARHVINTMIDRRPALVGRPADEDDVAALVNLARDRGLALAVRCGGHGVSGHGTCDGGVVIDMSGMNSIEVDPAAKTAKAGGGVTWGEMDAATQEHGLAVTGGRVPTTGIAGLTLGSGSGWLERKYGLTCDSLTSARVVLANGEVVTASPFQNEDLFWGLRGGGGNFGVVTEFTYNLHEVGPLILAGMLMYPREMAREVLRHYRDFIESAPDEVGGGIAFICAPPLPDVPPEVQGKPMVGVILAYFGDEAAGHEALRPMVEFGPPAMAMVAPMPYTALQMMQVDAFPLTARVYFKAEFMDELSDEAIDKVIEMTAEPTSPISQVLFQPMGGAIARVPAEETALPFRDKKWCYHALTVWMPEMGPDDVHVKWTRDLADAMKPYASDGIYLNFIADEGHDRVVSSYGPHYERLVALKDKYDPKNVFRLNQNIPPSGG
jgi:FAD binding domain/Berberine and berberine like